MTSVAEEIIRLATLNGPIEVEQDLLDENDWPITEEGDDEDESVSDSTDDPDAGTE